VVLLAVLILSLEGGVSQFLGDLQDEIKTSPYGGAGLEYGLSYYTTGYLQGSYSYLKLKNNADFSGLHQFIGRAGLETSEHVFNFASVGLGISLAGVRGNAATSEAENYMLNSSESEFGWNALLKLKILKFEKFTLGARFYYDRIWTKPKNSNLLQAGIFIEK
jgi:hypothetical protein